MQFKSKNAKLDPGINTRFQRPRMESDAVVVQLPEESLMRKDVYTVPDKLKNFRSMSAKSLVGISEDKDVQKINQDTYFIYDSIQKDPYKN